MASFDTRWPGKSVRLSRGRLEAAYCVDFFKEKINKRCVLKVLEFPVIVLFQVQVQNITSKAGAAVVLQEQFKPMASELCRIRLFRRDRFDALSPCLTPA